MLSFILLDLTLREIVTDIPHDVSAIIVYVLMGLLVGFVWYGGRGSAAADRPVPPPDHDPAH